MESYTWEVANQLLTALCEGDAGALLSILLQTIPSHLSIQEGKSTPPSTTSFCIPQAANPWFDLVQCGTSDMPVMAKLYPLLFLLMVPMTIGLDKRHEQMDGSRRHTAEPLSFARCWFKRCTVFLNSLFSFSFPLHKFPSNVPPLGNLIPPLPYKHFELKF